MPSQQSLVIREYDWGGVNFRVKLKGHLAVVNRWLEPVNMEITTMSYYSIDIDLGEEFSRKESSSDGKSLDLLTFCGPYDQKILEQLLEKISQTSLQTAWDALVIITGQEKFGTNAAELLLFNTDFVGVKIPATRWNAHGSWENTLRRGFSDTCEFFTAEELRSMTINLLVPSRRLPFGCEPEGRESVLRGFSGYRYSCWKRNNSGWHQVSIDGKTDLEVVVEILKKFQASGRRIERGRVDVRLYKLERL